MIGVDTNILLRWLLDDSIADDDAPHQTDLVSRTIIDSKETCYANIVVIAETLWVLANPLRQPKDIQAEIVDRLLTSYNIEVSERAALKNAVASFRKGPAGFMDYLIGEMNALAGCKTTLTFDKAAARTSNFTRLV